MIDEVYKKFSSINTFMLNHNHFYTAKINFFFFFYNIMKDILMMDYINNTIL